MGWTTYHLDKTPNKNGKLVYDRKGEIDKLFNWDNDSTTHKVLKSCMVGSTYYAAVESIKDNNRDVCAVIVLTSIDNSDYYNFGYKDIPESMHPYYYDCPMSILKLLTDTDDELANEWRKNCYKKIAQRKNSPSKLPVGTVIEFDRYLINGKQTIRLIKRNPAYQFKNTWWQIYGENSYYSKSKIPDDFRIVEMAQ